MTAPTFLRSAVAGLLAATALVSVPADAQPTAPAPAAPKPAAAPSATPLAQPKADELVGRVQAFYDRTQSFESDFQQEFWVKAYNQKKTSRGSVLFAKPGKMDWSYQDPKDNRVVSDGQTLKVFTAADKQMFEQPVQSSQYPAALSFLTGQGKLSDAFNFQAFLGEQMSFPGGQVLVGTPKTATAAYEKVLFYVDGPTAQVRRVLIVDGQGNRNRFDFVSPKVNVPVDAARFRFTPPPGTSVQRP